MLQTIEQARSSNCIATSFPQALDALDATPV